MLQKIKKNSHDRDAFFKESTEKKNSQEWIRNQVSQWLGYIMKKQNNKVIK